ncbi:MAG: hypothetical protein HUJ75_06165, partial [Parasporobacterium sp.]|nr:hypothetical protein [Parasporobacterium sp.]
REQVRECIDTFAPGGGFIFTGFVFGPAGQQNIEQRQFWLTDEYNKYGRPWYQNHK